MRFAWVHYPWHSQPRRHCWLLAQPTGWEGCFQCQVAFTQGEPWNQRFCLCVKKECQWADARDESELDGSCDGCARSSVRRFSSCKLCSVGRFYIKSITSRSSHEASDDKEWAAMGYPAALDDLQPQLRFRNVPHDAQP